MKTRDMKLSDYGISAAERGRLLEMARMKCNARLVRLACRESNPGLQEALYRYLTTGYGYDWLVNPRRGNMELFCKRDDFYAYARRAVFIFKMLLIADGMLEKPEKT